MGLGLLLGLSILGKIGSSALMYYAFGPASMKVHEKEFVDKYRYVRPPAVVPLDPPDEADVAFLSKICTNIRERNKTGAESAEELPIEDQYVGFRNNIFEHLILAKAIACNKEFVAIRDHKEENCWFFLRKTKPAAPVEGFDQPVFYLNERVCHKPTNSNAFLANCRLVLSQLRIFLQTKVFPSEKSNQTVEADKKDDEHADVEPVREEVERIETFLQEHPGAEEGSSTSFSPVPRESGEVRSRSNKGT